jgi:hypothetical protein
MKLSWNSFLLLLLCLSKISAGQGRIDSDPELFKIRMDASKADKSFGSNSQGDYKVYHNNDLVFLLSTGTDTFSKVVEIKKTPGAIQLTTCYYQNKLPTLIHIKRFKGELELNEDFYSKALYTSNRFTPLDSVSENGLLENDYQAQYFFIDQKVRYANIQTNQYTRVDEESDKKKDWSFFAGFLNFQIRSGINTYENNTHNGTRKFR